MATKTRRRNPKAPVAFSERLPHGTVIVEFEVFGRPVPWSAPFVTKTGGCFSKKALTQWKGMVRVDAKIAMLGKEVYTWPVHIDFDFELAPCSGNQKQPDLSNCVKSTEDALQGTVIANDRQVVSLSPLFVPNGTENRVKIKVVAHDWELR